MRAVRAKAKIEQPGDADEGEPRASRVLWRDIEARGRRQRRSHRLDSEEIKPLISKASFVDGVATESVQVRHRILLGATSTLFSESWQSRTSKRQSVRV